MKLLFYILSFTFLHLPNNTDKQIEFAQREFENIRKSNFEGVDDKYLTLEEFLEITKRLNPHAPEKILKKETDTYQEKKNLFLKNYRNTLNPLNLNLANCDSLLIDKVQIDSVRYTYKKLMQNSRDTTIYWPASQTYPLKEDDFIKNISLVYLSDENGSYVMQIESVYYNKEWRYYHSAKSPRIYRIK